MAYEYLSRALPADSKCLWVGNAVNLLWGVVRGRMSIDMARKNLQLIYENDSIVTGLMSLIGQGDITAAASNETTYSPKAWRPPLSEIRENVAEILRQRPDPRADDPRFVRFLADQLMETQRGKLNPGRVHRDLQERHDLDDWNVDLLFAIATIDLITTGAVN